MGGRELQFYLGTIHTSYLGPACGEESSLSLAMHTRC